MSRLLLWFGVLCFVLAVPATAQQSDQEIITQLMQRLADSERRIQALEQRLGMTSVAPGSATTPATTPVSAVQAASTPQDQFRQVRPRHQIRKRLSLPSKLSQKHTPKTCRDTTCRSRVADPN